MVRWLHPQHLLRTGLDSMVSSLFGARADARLIEALGRPQEPFFDYRGHEAQAPDAPFWLDYASDTGDGWDSTYAVAHALVQPTLSLSVPGTHEVHTTERGAVLVLGGDEVYPVARRDTYEQRLVQPYEAARRRSEAPHPHLYALPGNHDWYDGLAAFTRLFCARRWLAGWQTHQSRSYFALRLPRGWWLLGVDTQLESDIDFPQVEYFRAVAREMAEGDRVILCSAEPGTLHAAAEPPAARRGYLENNLAYLQERVLQGRVQVFLAGDLHQYRRHVDTQGAQRIIAGGGGAFLHPTHAPAAPVLADGSPQVMSYPSAQVSRRLMWRNLLLARYSPFFGLITGALYLLLALFTRAQTGHLTRFSDVVLHTLDAVVQRPSALALSLGTLLGLVAFGRFGYVRGGAIAGLLHGLAHLACAMGVAWGAEALWLRAPLLLAAGPTPTLAHFAQLALITFFGGFLVGPLLMGVYLLVSVNLFGAHMNEAAISLALPDWKNFLRLRIDPDGTLTLYPVGIARVPRRWRPTGAGPHAPAFEADDPRATPPALIEPPIVVTPSA